MAEIAKITIVNRRDFPEFYFFWRVAATTRGAFVPVRLARQAPPSNRDTDQLLSISAMKSTGLLCIFNHMYIFSHLRSSALSAIRCLAPHCPCRCCHWPADRRRPALTRGERVIARTTTHPSGYGRPGPSPRQRSMRGTRSRPPNRIGPFRLRVNEER